MCVTVTVLGTQISSKCRGDINPEKAEETPLGLNDG